MVEFCIIAYYCLLERKYRCHVHLSAKTDGGGRRRREFFYLTPRSHSQASGRFASQTMQQNSIGGSPEKSYPDLQRQNTHICRIVMQLM